MNAEQVMLVQQSFAKVVPISGTAATLFYDRLFETAPEVKPLFKGDMEQQKLALMQTLGIVVKGLTQPETILPAVKSLAERHKDYGVQPEHFQLVGASLLWTLEKGLGDAYTPDVHEAWVAAYTLLSGVMVDTMASSS
jgi:nitric oxide dioxygenase